MHAPNQGVDVPLQSLKTALNQFLLILGWCCALSLVVVALVGRVAFPLAGCDGSAGVGSVEGVIAIRAHDGRLRHDEACAARVLCREVAFGGWRRRRGG